MIMINYDCIKYLLDSDEDIQFIYDNVVNNTSIYTYKIFGVLFSFTVDKVDKKSPNKCQQYCETIREDVFKEVLNIANNKLRKTLKDIDICKIKSNSEGCNFNSNGDCFKK